MNVRHLAPTLAALALAAGFAGCSSHRASSPRDTVSSNDTVSASDTRPAPTDTVAHSDTTVQDTGPVDTTTPTDATTPTDTSSDSCTYSGWTPAGSTTAQITAGTAAGTYDNLFVDSYSDDAAVPFDDLGLEFYYPDANAGVHTFTFTGENYADCAECLLVYQGCDESFTCAHIFLASSGTLHVSENGSEGGAFKGSLTNVVLDEVTIDGSTYASTLVPNGQRWCIPSFTYDTTITLYTP